MIFYEIKRDRDEKPPQRSTGGIFETWRSTSAVSKELSEELARTNSLQPENPIHPIAMGKLKYAQWLNAYVYPQYKKGVHVSLKSMPYVPNTAPKVWFTVSEIQELHYHVNWDQRVRQPKAVGLINPHVTHSHATVFYPPCVLRPLFPEEVNAIDSLRNQTGDGRISASDDPSVGVDDQPDYAG